MAWQSGNGDKHSETFWRITTYGMPGTLPTSKSWQRAEEGG
jgi:hypothetical protein